VCTTDSCDPVFGCGHTPVLNGTPCATAPVQRGRDLPGRDPARRALHSTATTATAAPRTRACPPPAARTCDSRLRHLRGGRRLRDGNPCTADVCTDGVCSNSGAAQWLLVQRRQRVHGDETCQSGTCTAGSPLTCNDSNVCTTTAVIRPRAARTFRYPMGRRAQMAPCVMVVRPASRGCAREVRRSTVTTPTCARRIAVIRWRVARTSRCQTAPRVVTATYATVVRPVRRGVHGRHGTQLQRLQRMHDR